MSDSENGGKQHIEMTTASAQAEGEGAAPDPYRAVLAIFIGRNTEKFLKLYDKTNGDLSKLATGWTWPGFFVPFPWLLYRKLYLEAAVVIFVPIALTFIFPVLADAGSFGLTVIVAVMGKSYYLQRADRKIKAILDEGGTVDETEARIAAAGGVSPASAWIGAAIMVALVGIAVADAMQKLPT